VGAGLSNTTIPGSGYAQDDEDIIEPRCTRQRQFKGTLKRQPVGIIAGLSQMFDIRDLHQNFLLEAFSIANRPTASASFVMSLVSKSSSFDRDMIEGKGIVHQRLLDDRESLFPRVLT
jgi:hypothetical protein